MSLPGTSSPWRSPGNTLFAVRSMTWQLTFKVHGKVIAGGSVGRTAFVKQALADCQTGSFQLQVRRRLLAWLPVEMRLLPSDCDQLNPREQPGCSKEFKKKKKSSKLLKDREAHREK